MSFDPTLLDQHPSSSITDRRPSSARMWLLATGLFLVAAGPVAGLTIEPFADKLVLQQHEVLDPQSNQSLNGADRLFSGTYDGVAEPIEGRLVDAVNGAPLSPWQVLDAAPDDGTWSGSLLAIPAGGWYRLEARKANSNGDATVSGERFGVGLVVLTLGQSNMARMFTEDAADGSPVAPQAPAHDLTWRLGYGEPSGYDYERPRDADIPVTWGPVTGSGGIRLANRLQSTFGVPVLILDLALDWTGIDAHWNELDGPFVGWSRLLSALQQVDGIGAVVWAQGAYDAINRPDITAEDYLASLDTLYGRLRAATDQVDDPAFGIVHLNRGDYTQDGRFDASFQAIRRAQRQWIETRPQGFAAGTALDIELSTRPEAGVGHFWATGYELLADRIAQGLSDALAPTTLGASIVGGQLTQATLHGRHIVVEVAHDRGSRLLVPDSQLDIEGFEVTAGTWGVDDVTIERAVLSSSQAGNHVVLTLAQEPTSPLQLRYLYGQNPNHAPSGVVARRRRGNWLYDDFTYHPERSGLPIQDTLDDLTVFDGGPLNLPPTPRDDALAVGRGGQVTIPVLNNDSDPEGQLAIDSVVLLEAPRYGVATVDSTDGSITYQHVGGSETDTFTYAVADDQGNLSPAASVQISLLGASFPALPGRVMHLESGLGLKTDQGGRTIVWRDQSGLGNDLRATGDAFREVAALNGQDCIALDGQGDKLERTSGLRQLPGGASDRTVFTVMRYRDEGFGGFAWGSTTEGQSCATHGNRVFGLIVDPAGNLSVQGWCEDFRSSTPGTDRGWLVQSAKVESNVLTHYWNGKLIDQQTHSFNTNADGILVVGAELDSSPYLQMDVAAALIFDHALSEDERMVVDSYLRQKYLGEQTMPPITSSDIFEVVFGATVELSVLDNDSGQSSPLDPSSVSILEPPLHGELTLDPATGVLTYHHDGSVGTDDQFTYTITDSLGQVSPPTSVQLSLVAPAAELVTDGLVLHLESDQGVVTTWGDEVTTWLDGSTAGNDVTAPSAGPRLRSGSLGDHIYLSFDGSNDQLSRLSETIDLPVGDADRSVFLLVRYNGDGFGGVTWGAPQCNGTFGPVVDSRGLLAVQGWCAGYDMVSSRAGEGAGWQVQSVVHGQSTLRHFSNGELLQEKAHVFDTAEGQLALGREIDGFPFVAMDLAAVLIYDRALDATDRWRVEAFLQEKYLASSPPGEDAPPIAVDDLLEATVGQATALSVLANDSDDIALDVTTLTLHQPPAHGVVSLDLTQGQVIYQHDGGDSWNDRLTYSVDDDSGQTSEVATVFITLGSPLPVVDGLVLRLEPQAGAQLDDGDNHLDAWLDLSGSGNHVVTWGRPRLDNIGPGGRPYVRLDGFDDHLENLDPLLGLPGGAEDRTLFAVLRYHSNGFGGVSYGTAACNQVFGAVVDNGGRLATQGWCQGNDLLTSHQASGTGWLTQTSLLASETLWQYRDGELVDSTGHAFATAADGRLMIGAELDGSPHLEMDVAAVLIYDRALGEEERLAVESYLGQRYRGATPPPSPLATFGDIGHATLGGDTWLDVLANDQGDLDPSTLEIVAPPLHGSVSVGDAQTGALLYHHDGDTEAYVDRFTYRLADTDGTLSEETEVELVIVPVTDGLAFHLDAAVGPVLQGSALIGWRDLASQANDLGALGDPRPSTTRNGADAVHFDGSQDQLQNLYPLAGLPGNDQERTVLVVANYLGGGFGGVTWGSTSEGNCASLGNRAFGTVVDFRGELAIQGWCFGNDFLSGSPGTGAGWLVQTTVAGGGSFDHFRDGVLVDTAAHVFATDGNGRLVIAAELDGSPAVTMELASVMIFDRRLDDGERQLVEDSLRRRFIED